MYLYFESPKRTKKRELKGMIWIVNVAAFTGNCVNVQ